MSSQADRDSKTLGTISTGVWLVAAVVMAVSASTAADLMSAHHMPWISGLALGIATDIGLCIGLLGDQTLARMGLNSRWSKALRWTGLGMSLIYNTAESVKQGDALGAALHGTPVLLLLVLTEAAQDYRMKLAVAAESASTPSASRPAATRSASSREAGAAQRREAPVVRVEQPPARPSRPEAPAVPASREAKPPASRPSRPEPPALAVQAPPAPTREAAKRETAAVKVSDEEAWEWMRTYRDKEGGLPTVNKVKTSLEMGARRAERLLAEVDKPDVQHPELHSVREATA